MNKLIIFAAGVIAGSVIPLVTQVHSLSNECIYLKSDLKETKSRLENAEKKIKLPALSKTWARTSC